MRRERGRDCSREDHLRGRLAISLFGLVLCFLTAVGCGPSETGRGVSTDGDDQDRDAVDQVLSDPGREPDLLAPLAAVHLNEVACRGLEWVELVLAEGEAVDLAGWILTDDPTRSDHRYPIPTGVRLEAGEFLVLPSREAGTGQGFDFGIACGRDRLSLLAADGREADGVLVGAVEDGQSWGRLPDGAGPFQVTRPTPGAPNQAFVDETEALFDPFEVGLVELSLTEQAMESLSQDPYSWVPADFTFTWPDGRQVGPWFVALHLKGQLGSLQGWEGKPAFKIRLDHLVPDQELAGLDRLTLNNLVQDPSTLREILAYDLFRAFGVPAPRVGYVFVTVNGEPFGLYSNVETPDAHFLARWFDSTRHLYEATYGVDIRLDSLLDFEVDVGDEHDYTGLLALIAALDQAPQDALLTSTAHLVDWQEALRMMAVEVWSGHWDGYAPTVNNYYLHEDEDGRFSLIPWGTDQAFTSFWPFHVGGGLLFQRCILDRPCKALFDAILSELADLVWDVDFTGRIDAIGDALATSLSEDPRRPYDDTAVRGARQELVYFLQERRQQVSDLLECLERGENDPDGDGFTCDLDCDEEEPGVHVYAAEVCSDGIDQDCSGAADDAWECPDCQEVYWGPHRYLVCTRYRWIWDSLRRCEENGTLPAILETEAENQWLSRQAQAIQAGRYWIGLFWSEEFSIPDYYWFNGLYPRYSNWARPPSPEGERYCTVLTESGQWLAVPCWEGAGIVCEEYCPPYEDRDGDGYLRCSGDCDDGDEGVHPGAAEVCSDGIDQDCSGIADDGPDCG